MKTVLISGGSGLVGRKLTQLLLEKGHEVRHLARKARPADAVKVFEWNVDQGKLDEHALEGVTSFIHLAGAGIADRRWTKRRKQEIIDGRVKSAELVFKYIEEQNFRLSEVIGASAVGYYGAITASHIFTEHDPPANDFLGTCCRLWEESYQPFVRSGVRTVILRTPVVLSSAGGALHKLSAPVRSGMGAALGTGEQFMPWIHENDLGHIYLEALENSAMKGVYNCAAQQPLTNRELMQALASRMNKKLRLPAVPAFVLKLLFGEMADMFLQGSRVSTKKLEQAGFECVFRDIDKALEDLIP